MTDGAPVCVRCGRPGQVNRGLCADVFEGMHWLCSHLAYEHPGDPGAPCDDPSCDVWRLQVYAQALREAVVHPAEVMPAAISRRYTLVDHGAWPLPV